MSHRLSSYLLTILGVLCVSAASFGSVAPEPTAEERLADEILKLTNTVRAEHKLPALKREARLDKTAVLFSRYMGEAGFFDHVGPDGQGIKERIVAQGYPALWWGENIAWGGQVSAKQLVDDWMGSPTHRRNLLQAEFKEIGIGIARARGRTFVTQDFGTQRPPRR